MIAKPARPPAGPLWIDLAILVAIVALFAGLLALGRRWAEPQQPVVSIDLSLSALPGYTLLTLSRGFAAYAISLAFTLVYASAAAHSRRAEKVMIPLLDILQGVPVLAFLPGLVLSLVRLFPGSNVGLELACIIAIFSGQAWNMTFSYFASVRAIPIELLDIARLHRFGPLRRFVRLELPSAAIGLLWNSMVSMAGGWFFITVIESFTLKDRATGRVLDFRLPGIGSYMVEAYAERDFAAMAFACVAMVLVVVVIDQLLWRPLLAWAQKFKLEDSEGEKPTSWLYDLLRRSWLFAWTKQTLARRRAMPGAVPPPAAVEPTPAASAAADAALERSSRILSRIGWAFTVAAGLLALRGGIELVKLLGELTLHDWLAIHVALGYSTLRVLAAVVISAAWTVPFGIAVGLSPRLSRVVQPVIQVVASFPFPMLYPVIATALVSAGIPFGVGCIALMMLGAQWYSLFNVVAGAMAIPQDLREVAAVYGLRGLARFRRLYLAGIFPYLVTGLITAAGGAWNASIVSEFVTRGADEPLVAPGIGAYLWHAFTEGDDHLLAAGVLVLSVALVLLNRFVWKPLYRLADERFALNR